MGRLAVWLRPPGDNHWEGLCFNPREYLRKASKLGAEHDVAIFAPLAPLDVNDHSLTVDIADLQASQFGTPHSGGVERHEHDAMKGSQGGVDQASDLFLTENHAQAERVFRIRRFRHAPGLLERLDVDETQSRQSLVHRVRRQLPLLEQRGLILADVFRT